MPELTRVCLLCEKPGRKADLRRKLGVRLAQVRPAKSEENNFGYSQPSLSAWVGFLEILAGSEFAGNTLFVL